MQQIYTHTHTHPWTVLTRMFVELTVKPCREFNPRPSCCEATALNTLPPCCRERMTIYFYHWQIMDVSHIKDMDLFLDPFGFDVE